MKAFVLLLLLTLVSIPAAADPATRVWKDELSDPFVHDLAVFRDELWIAGFSQGTSILSGGRMRTVKTPFRYPNRMLATEDTLYIAASEGLFYTRDGVTFERVDAIDQRGVNGIARDGSTLLVTAPAVLYRLTAGKRPAVTEAHWRPAGTRALQGITVEGKTVYLASEDRGIIAFRGGAFVSHDRLTGLPSSWIVDVTGDGQGGVFAATLRHGVVHLGPRGEVLAAPAVPSVWTLRLARDAAGLWVGTQHGMTDTLENALPDPRVHARIAHQGKLYFGTEAGLLEMAR